MNIVYKITFTKRQKDGIKPFMYIGSKSNCTFDGQNIIDKNGKIYIGSSKYKNYKKIASDDILQIEILFSSESYKDVLEKERYIHIKNDVKLSDNYFNQGIATICTYSDPEYRTMKNVKTNKICRLKECEITQDWVGISKGFKWYTNGVNDTLSMDMPNGEGWRRGRTNSKASINNFYKNSSFEEVNRKAVKTRKENGNYVAYNKGFKGVFKHSEETKEKMKQRPKKYKEKNGMFGKIVINDGVVNKTILKTETIPMGWQKGRLKKLNKQITT